MIRCRYAPSPTGGAHLGNARTALLAWLQCRAMGGSFILRVEDLDVGRVRPGLTEQQLDELRWLGLDWDEGPDVGGPFGPYLQSLRMDSYEAALRTLAARGSLFECTCSRKDIASAASAPHEGDEGLTYPGTCRARRVPPDTSSVLVHARGAAALRFRVEPGEVCFHDLLWGRWCTTPASRSGDFVVRRRDGVPAYHLAVAVDDDAMRVTHVVRAADLLDATANQILLYHALGLAPPAFLHVPLVLGADGQRLAKRHGAVSLTELRQGGADPRRVVGWLASTCGLARPGEEVAPRALVGRFDPARIPREPLVATAAQVAALLPQASGPAPPDVG